MVEGITDFLFTVCIYIYIYIYIYILFICLFAIMVFVYSVYQRPCCHNWEYFSFPLSLALTVHAVGENQI